MKICLINNLKSNAKLCKATKAYDKIWSLHMKEALAKIGVETVFVSCTAKSNPQIPHVEADHTILVIGTRRRGPAAENHCTETSGKLWQLFACWRCCVPWPEGAKKENYVGIGVNPEFLYPEDPDSILFQNYVGWPLDYPPNVPFVSAFKELKKMGYNIRMLPITYKEYIPWMDICELYRGCRVFMDATPVPLELGRLEAAACGAALVYPIASKRFGHVESDMNIIKPQTWLTDVTPDSIVKKVLEAYEASSINTRKERSKFVHAHFTWDAAAERLVSILKQPFSF